MSQVDAGAGTGSGRPNGPVLVFTNPRKPGWAAGVSIGVAVLFFLCAGLMFLMLLITPPSSKMTMMPGLLGGVMVVPIFSLIYGLMLLKSPVRATLDDEGLSAEWLIARKRLRWGQIARIRREKLGGMASASIFTPAHKRRSQDVLVMLDERGKELARLTSALTDFPALVVEVERRSSAARGTPTYDRAAEVGTRRAKARRTSKLLAVLGVVLVAGAGFGAVFSVLEHRAAVRLEAEGVTVGARVVRHYMFNVAPHVEYAFQDAGGREHTRDAMLEVGAWEELRGKETVEVKYVPSDPSRSRLVYGEVEQMDLPLPLILIAFTLMGVMGVLLVLAPFLGIADIKLKDGKARIVRFDQLGDDLEEGPEAGTAAAAAVTARPVLRVPDAVTAANPARAGGGGITAMAVLNIVFGAWAVGLNTLRLALMTWLAAQGGSKVIEVGQNAVEVHVQLFSVLTQSAGFVLGVLLLVSGIGLLMRRRWGRTLALAAAAGQCVLGVVLITGVVINPLPSLVEEDQQLSRLPLEQIGAVFVLLLGMVYPVVMLAVLGRRAARERLRA